MTSTIEDIAFPGMPTPDPLWGVRLGDGEVLAMPSRRVAELHRELCDEMDAKMRDRGGEWFNNAAVVEWTGTSAEHADAMAAQEAA